MKMIIVGCGRTGSGLARALSHKGHSVAVIDPDPAAFALLPANFKGSAIKGAGLDREVLIEAGIERADGLAAVTTSDEANIVIARAASRIFRVPKVVARLYYQHKADIYKRLGLQTIDPVAWGVNRAADMLCFCPLNTVLSIGGDVDIIEIEVPALLIGRTVRELTVAGEIMVTAITRNNRTFLPASGTEFQVRDLIHLTVAVKSLDHLNVLLGL